MNVLVYGSLRQGFGNHELLKDSKFIGSGWASGWRMYSLGAFPMITPGVGAIYVEAYEINDVTLAHLDALEGYPYFYNRKEWPADITDETMGSKFMAPVIRKGWIYYMERDMTNSPYVKSGKWERK